MEQNTRVFQRFQYHLEDCECRYCLHFKGKKRGCALKECCCDGIKQEAIESGRIKRGKQNGSKD